MSIAERIEKLEKSYNEAEAARIAQQNILKEEFGVSSLKEANTLLAEKQAEADALKAELEQLEAKLLELLP